jgi:RNA polymerase sigma-70 factor (ECF subfamily)
MAEVRKGDSSRLGTLFDRHHVALFRYAMRLSGNRDWSEDLVQEIFTRILKYRQTFRDGNPFVTWMYRIARNAYIDQSRKRRWEVQTEEPVEYPVAPDNRAEQDQDLAILERAAGDASRNSHPGPIPGTAL